MIRFRVCVSSQNTTYVMCSQVSHQNYVMSIHPSGHSVKMSSNFFITELTTFSFTASKQSEWRHFEPTQISRSSYFLLNLVSIGDSCLIHFTMVVAKCWSQLQHSLCIHHLTLSIHSTFFLFSLSLPFSLIWTHWFLTFSMGYNLWMSLIILVPNIPALAGGSSFKLAPLSYEMPTTNFFF